MLANRSLEFEKSIVGKYPCIIWSPLKEITKCTKFFMSYLLWFKFGFCSKHLIMVVFYSVHLLSESATFFAFSCPPAIMIDSSDEAITPAVSIILAPSCLTRFFGGE